MPKGFFEVRYHVSKRKKGSPASISRSANVPKGVHRSLVSFNSDEAAARFYLSKVFEQDKRTTIRRLSRGPSKDGLEDAELVPDMQYIGVQEIPMTKTRLVHFKQTQKSIPVFGSHTVVELDQNRNLVDVTSGVAPLKKMSAIPLINERDAFEKIKELTETNISIDEVEPPKLMFFFEEEKGTWHLVYFFKKVEAAPKNFIKNISKPKSKGHGLGISPRQLKPRINYLVDADDGTVLFYYSANPFIDIPSECMGIDELNQYHKFYGRVVNNDYELDDPIRNIKTYDSKGGDIEKRPLPNRTVVSKKSHDWKDTNKAAISAHVNGTRVYDFLKTVLKRDGIDDKGMDLISIVNVTYSKVQSPPGEYHNAFWWNNRMWYGQKRDKIGKLCSYARYLDIIAHELTHGIIQYSSNLVYKFESGALNESFCDIFGIIINNYYTLGPKSNRANWNWEIGSGLSGGNLPLRDMSDPKRTNDPEHMDNYLVTYEDEGGVHTNSNIHNKAAYNLMTAKDKTKKYVFTLEEVAMLYYLCLCRISQRATFSDVLRELMHIAKTIWAGDKKKQNEKLKHIKAAYKRVGIQ